MYISRKRFLLICAGAATAIGIYCIANGFSYSILGSLDPKIRPTKSERSKNLESSLVELTQSSDPEVYAQKHGLYFANGRVRVVIELDNPNYALPASYGVEETRYENMIQALVVINKLLELSESPFVRFITIPMVPADQGRET